MRIINGLMLLCMTELLSINSGHAQTWECFDNCNVNDVYESDWELDNPDWYGRYLIITNPLTGVVNLSVEVYVDNGYSTSAFMNKYQSGLRWKRTCDGSEKQLVDLTADITGDVFSWVNTVVDIGSFNDFAEAIGEFSATARVTGDTQAKAETRAIRVDNGSVELGASASVGTSGGGVGGHISWSPSTTGTSGSNVGGFQAAGASYSLREDAVFAETYINLLQTTVRAFGEAGTEAFCEVGAIIDYQVPG